MNKIFKVKQSANGSVVTSELAKNNSIKATVLGLSLMIGAAGAEIINDNSAFNAIDVSGETASGYQAQTASEKSTANGYSSFAVANGTVAIGAESGASGNGLSYDDTRSLIDVQKEVKRIDDELAKLVGENFTNPNPKQVESFSNYYNVIDVEKSLEQGKKVYKVLDSYADYEQFKSEVLKLANGAAQNQKLGEVAISRLQDISVKSPDELSDADKGKYDLALEAVINYKNSLESTPSFKLNPKYEGYYSKIENVIEKLSNYAVTDNAELNKLAQTFLPANDHFNSTSNLDSDLLFMETLGYFGSTIPVIAKVNNEVSDLAKDYDVFADADGSKLTQLIEDMRAEAAKFENGSDLAFYLSLPEEMQELLQDRDFRVVTAISSRDYIYDENTGMLGFEKNGTYAKYLKVLKYLEENNIQEKSADFINKAVAGYIHFDYLKRLENEPSNLTDEFITRFESEAKAFLEKNQALIAKRAELEAEKKSVINKFVDIAKSMGYEEPTYEDLQKILGSLTPNAISVGYRTFSSGNASVAMGAYALATGNESIALGTNATALSSAGIAIGSHSIVKGDQSIAIGENATVTGANVVALGTGTLVESNDVVALGKNVSVAEGFDKAVVLGSESTAEQANPVKEATIRDTKYAFAGTAPTSTVSVGSQGAERQIVNVAAGRISESSTDAINGSQLYAVISAVEAIPNLAAGNNINIVETPDAGKTLYSIHANQTTVTAGEGVTVTSKAIAKDGYTVTDYVVSISDTILAKLNETAPVVEAPQNVVNEYKGDNVVAGKNITVVKTPNDEGFNDAVVSLADDIDVNSVKVGDVNITVDGGINAGDKPISNVAAGTNPSDAVNVSQLNEARSDVKAGSEAMVVTQEPNNETGGQTFIVDLSDGTKAQIAKEESVSAGKNIVVNHNGTNETGGNDFVVSLSDEITVQAVNVGSASITADKGIDAGGQPISNVAAGVKPTDAVNVAQLNAVSKTTVEAGSEFITVDELNNSDGSKTYRVDASKETKAAVAKVNKGFNVKTQDGKSKNVQLGDTVSIVGDGKNITTLTAPNGDIQVALADDAVFNTVKTAKPAEISPTSREVVQGSQLHATNQQVQKNAQNIKRLDDKIDRNKKQARKGVASAAAMAMLPQPTISGHSIVGAATTHYRGEQALAVGYSRLSDNGRHLIKLSGASNVSGKKEAIVGAAYGFQW